MLVAQSYEIIRMLDCLFFILIL